MLEEIRDLIAHKGHANAAMLTAIRENEPARSDPELCELLHHVLLANRFWLCTLLALPFAFEEESQARGSIDDLRERYSRTQAQEAAWLATATEADLARVLEHPLIPGGRCSVAQALLQVCLHSHGHRAQCARMLRRHGGVPPQTDFILWVASRPAVTSWPGLAPPPA